MQSQPGRLRQRRRRLGAGGALLLTALLPAVSACPWRSYEEIMSVHVDVLSGEADKIVGNAEIGHRPSPADITEMTYPLQRARQFAYQYRAYASRPSYASFVALLDAYERLTKEIDAARGDEQRWKAILGRLPVQYADLRRDVREVRAALTKER